jgi:hypothetical protein
MAEDWVVRDGSQQPLIHDQGSSAAPHPRRIRSLQFR